MLYPLKKSTNKLFFILDIVLFLLYGKSRNFYNNYKSNNGINTNNKMNDKINNKCVFCKHITNCKITYNKDNCNKYELHSLLLSVDKNK